MWLHSSQQANDGCFDFNLPQEMVFQDRQYRLLLDTVLQPAAIDILDGCAIIIVRHLDYEKLVINVAAPDIDTEEKFKNHLNTLAKMEATLKFLNTESQYLSFTKKDTDTNLKIKAAERFLLYYHVEFSPEMCRVLNIPENKKLYANQEILCRNVNLSANVGAFIVTCNLVEPAISNDSYENIIAMYSAKKERRKTDSTQVTYDYKMRRVDEYHSNLSLPVAAGRVAKRQWLIRVHL